MEARLMLAGRGDRGNQDSIQDSAMMMCMRTDNTNATINATAPTAG